MSAAISTGARLIPKAVSLGARYFPGLFRKAVPVAESIGKGLAGAGRGAVRPAIEGAAEIAGKVAPGAAGAAPEAAAKLPGNWLSRGVRRAGYGLFGKAPEGEAGLQHLKDIGLHTDLRTGGVGKGQLGAEWAKKGRIGRWLYGPNEAEFVRKSKLQDIARQEGLKSGYGTLRGVGAGLLSHPGDVMSKGWGSMGKAQKAMTVGFGGLDAYHVATAKPEDRGKAIGSALVSTPAWIATGGMSNIPMMLGTIGGVSAGEHAGARGQQLVGKFLGRKPPVPNAMPQANLPNVPPSVQ